MEFKRIITHTDVLWKRFSDFCVKSKPYSFCETPSLRLKIFKIREYYDFLLAHSEIFILEDNQEILFFVAVHREGSAMVVDFAFGTPMTVLHNLKAFRDWYRLLNKDVEFFYTELTRRYKLDKYVNFIRRYDRNAQIKLDNQKISIYWYS